MIKLAFKNYSFSYLLFHLFFQTIWGIVKFLPSPIFDYLRFFYLKFFFKKLKTFHIRDGITIYHPSKIDIEENVSLNENIYLNGLGGIQIKNGTRIGHNCSILTMDHVYKDKKKPIYLQGSNFKKIEIGKNCWIGARCIILKGVKIGDNCIIAAGTVVTKSFKKNQIIAGVPGKKIAKN
jgi:acetyltransferase-like isoleucine patch superfamily enzyme